MKKLLLILVVLSSAHLSVQAQNKVPGAPPTELLNRPKVVKVKQPSQAEVLTEIIKKDAASRSNILANTQALKATLVKKFGDQMSIHSKAVVSQMLQIARDQNQSVLIRREALKVLYGRIPAGHILEETK